jgi:circadian clock protein KaiC
MAVAQRLFTYAKSMGITMVMTSLLSNSDTEMEVSRMPISTLADTWIHVTYVNQGGERNRALTIIKSRGTKHSNQVRELILDDQGIHLTDVYTAGGAVLMGTLRWEKEQAQAQEKDRQRQMVMQRRRELEIAEAELRARMESLQQQLEVQRIALAQLSLTESEQEERWMNQKREVQRLRTPDAQE